MRHSRWSRCSTRSIGVVAAVVVAASRSSNPRRTASADDAGGKVNPVRGTTAFASPTGLVASLPAGFVVPLPTGVTFTDPAGTSISLTPTGVGVSFPLGTPSAAVTVPGGPALSLPLGSTFTQSGPSLTIAFPGGTSLGLATTPGSSFPLEPAPSGMSLGLACSDPNCSVSLAPGSSLALANSTGSSLPLAGVVPPSSLPLAEQPTVVISLVNLAGVSIPIPAGDLSQGLVPTFGIEIVGGGYSVSIPSPAAGGNPKSLLPVVVEPKKGTSLRVKTAGRVVLKTGRGFPSFRLTCPQATTLSFPQGSLSSSSATDARLRAWLERRAKSLLR